MESYWTTTAKLPRFPSLSRDVQVDAVVIGAGLTGITAAHLLKKAGAKVALIERGRCAATDTAHTTAHLTYVTDYRLHQLVKTFGREGAKAFWEAGQAALDQIAEIVRDASPDCGFEWVPGYLHAALDQEEKRERESLEQDARLAGEFGFKARFLDQVPWANRPGIRFENQAKFHPLNYLAPLLAKIEGDGSYVFEGTEAHEVEEKPLTVHAAENKIQGEFLVIATHTPLLGKAGLLSGSLLQSKLALYTSYAIGARIPQGLVPNALFWDTSKPYYYLRLAGLDYAIFGGADVKTGQEHDPRAVFEKLAAKFQAVLPQAVLDQRWCGQVVETNDGLPFIGENSEDQFVATGFSGNGLTLGTLAAVMARDRYLKRKNPWRDLFAVNRRKFHGGTWRYLKENLDYPYYLLRDRLAQAEGDSLDQLRPNQGKILKLDGEKVAAYRAADGVVTLCSPVCTHLGCLVRWNDADKTWDCPCHGSRFHPDGMVHSGPAEAPLTRH